MSLHSLLVSQKSTILENISEAMTEASEAELKSSAAAEALVARSEISARYQTSNSNNVQSSRKAIVQTLFKEFRELPLEFRLAENDKDRRVVESPQDLLSDSSGLAWNASNVRRGDLVEIQVELSVDPVFKLGSMMSEWTSMAEDWPGMFTAQGALGFLQDAQPIMKVLDRFLAGLIPIKALATDHVVVTINGSECIVRRDSISGLGLETRALKVVGVTEHLGYWKDIRRVLFSGAQFTMLCRVARDGIHDSWTPVKLADLFSEVAPGLVDQINAIEFSGNPMAGGAVQPSEPSALDVALTAYKDWLVNGDPSWKEDADAQFQRILINNGGESSATSQRAAFNSVRELATATLDLDDGPSPEEDLQARQRARDAAGLPLFPALAPRTPSPPIRSGAAQAVGEDRLIDVEVIAIYW
ncbi:MAG: hypothetical protein ACE367_14285 [Acidimicrobiales bacterium]